MGENLVTRCTSPFKSGRHGRCSRNARKDVTNASSSWVGPETTGSSILRPLGVA
jgi:hypothetical protein